MDLQVLLFLKSVGWRWFTGSEGAGLIPKTSRDSLGRNEGTAPREYWIISSQPIPVSFRPAEGIPLESQNSLIKVQGIPGLAVSLNTQGGLWVSVLDVPKLKVVLGPQADTGEIL